MTLEAYLKKLGLSIKDAESIFGEIITEYIKCCSDKKEDVAVKNNVDQLTKAILSLMNSEQGREEIQEYAKKRNITLSGDDEVDSIDLEFDTEEEDWEEVYEEDDLPEDLFDDLEEVEEIEEDDEDEEEALINEEKKEEEPEVEDKIEVEEDLEEEEEEETEFEEAEPVVEEPEELEEEVEEDTEVEEMEPEEEEEIEKVEEPEVEEEMDESDYYMAEIPIADIRKKSTEGITQSISRSMRMANQNFIAREKNVNTYVFQFGNKNLFAYIELNTTTNEAVIYGEKLELVNLALQLIGEDYESPYSIEIKPAGDIKDSWEEESKAFRQVVRYNYMPIDQAVIEPRLIDNLLNMSISNIVYMIRLQKFITVGNRKIKEVNCVPKDYPKYLWGNYGLKVNEDFDVQKTLMVENELVEMGLIEMDDDEPKLTGNGYMLIGFIMRYIFPNNTTKFGNIYYEPDLLYTYGNSYVSVSDDTTLYGNEAFMETGGSHLDFYPIFNSKQTSKELAKENTNSAYYQKKYMDAVNNLFNEEAMYKERGYKFPFVGDLGIMADEEKDYEYKGNTVGTTIFSLESQLYSISVDTALINYFKKYYLTDGGYITLIKITDMESDSLVGVVKNSKTEQRIIGLIKANGVNERTNPCLTLPDGKAPDFIALYSQNAWIDENESLTRLNSYKDVAAEMGVGQEVTETDEVAEEILDRALTPENDIKGMLERKIKARKLLLEDMKDEGEEQSSINKLTFKIEIYQEQLDELNN